MSEKGSKLKKELTKEKSKLRLKKSKCNSITNFNFLLYM